MLFEAKHLSKGTSPQKVLQSKSSKGPLLQPNIRRPVAGSRCFSHVASSSSPSFAVVFVIPFDIAAAGSTVIFRVLKEHSVDSSDLTHYRA